MSGTAGSPGIHPKVMGQNPLSGGVASATKKLGDNLSGCILISEIQWKSLLDRLKACENNDDRLAILDREKLPFLFSSAQLMIMLDITLSVKTRLAMITQIGPRLTDPKAKSSQLIALFRYSEEKERVEGVLKARTKVVMASNTSLFRPQGNLAATLVADHSNHSSSQSQNNPSTSTVPSITIKGLTGARQKSALPALNPLQLYEPPMTKTTTTTDNVTTSLDVSPVNDSNGESSIWRDVNTPPRGTKKEPASYTTTSTTTTKTTYTNKYSQLPLQEGWTPMHDSGTDQIYYYNEITGDSQWDPPLAVESPSSREQKKKLPSGWTIMKDPSTGSVYYYNRTTGESTWDFPKENKETIPSTLMTGNVSSTTSQSPTQPQSETIHTNNNNNNTNTSPPARSITSSPVALPTPPEPPRELPIPRQLPDGWIALIDPGSGTTYYVHRASNTSQWEIPQEIKPIVVAPPPPPIPPTPVVPTLPYGWSEMYDDKSQKHYYANHLTGQSQWDMPVV